MPETFLQITQKIKRKIMLTNEEVETDNTKKFLEAVLLFVSGSVCPPYFENLKILQEMR